MIGVSPLKEDLRIVESDIEIDEVLELKVKGHGCLPEGGRLKAVIRGIEKTVPIPAAALPIPISLNGEWKISTDRPNVILTDKWKVSYDNGQCPADFCSDEYSFDGFYDFRMGAWENAAA